MIKSLSNESLKFLKDINADKLFQQREKMRIAVTGLSRSGKTVFITSLINQLISGKRLNSLGKDFVTRIVPPDGDELPEFEYKAILQGVRDSSPLWPKSTSSISKINLEIEVKSESDFFPNKILELEIIDYPGEWLLDLPMFEMNFDEWSAETFSDINSSARKEYSQAWQDELRKHDIYGFTDGSQDKQIVDEYQKYMDSLRKDGFSVIQPGRHIQPGGLKDSSILLFTPLPKPKYITPHQDSIYTRFKQRYDRYSREMVRKLLLEYFSQFDRQIILVDVLKTLQSGYNSFIDMTKALRLLMEIYDYGDQSFLKKWIGSKIDKVIFAATKADYVANSQHGNYKKLLESVVEEAVKELNIKGIETSSDIIASVKSTEDVIKEYNGRNLSCLKGSIVGGSEESIEYPGEVPSSFPSKEEWKQDLFNFANFSPIPFPDRDSDSVPHINMDSVIEKLIGDRL
jgi:predicted YcjX-like family ATPase